MKYPTPITPALVRTLFVAALTLTACASPPSPEASGPADVSASLRYAPDEIHMRDLAAIQKGLKPNERILDVRTPGEFALGHIPGAMNIDHARVGAEAARLKKFDRLYVYCSTGRRAGIAVEELAKRGLRNLIWVKDSGMSDWAGAGLSVEKKSP